MDKRKPLSAYKRNKLKVLAVDATSTAMAKRAMIESLRVHRGQVTTAAKAAGIKRSTHYTWLSRDVKYAAAVVDIKDFVLDEVEAVAYKMMLEDRNTAMIIFFLKCQGKHRGYVERAEVEHTISDKLKESVKLAISTYEKAY